MRVAASARLGMPSRRARRSPAGSEGPCASPSHAAETRSHDSLCQPSVSQTGQWEQAHRKNRSSSADDAAVTNTSWRRLRRADAVHTRTSGSSPRARDRMVAVRFMPSSCLPNLRAQAAARFTQAEKG